MKPILEWFELLPEPYRSQAIENYNPEWEKKSVKGINGNEVADSLDCGFQFEKTPQGFKYWLAIFNRALSGEFDKKK
jgi:hypothetical protein